MNCPMIQPKLEIEGGEEFVRMGKCTEAECAWWSPGWRTCAVLLIAAALEDISTAVRAIREFGPGSGR